MLWLCTKAGGWQKAGKHSRPLSWVTTGWQMSSRIRTTGSSASSAGRPRASCCRTCQPSWTGRYQPQGNDERLVLLGVCQATNRAFAPAHLFADIFRAAPHLAEDLAARHSYNAARAAAQAGFGVSKNSAGLEEPEKKQWREQAREWLRADLAA